MDKQNGYLRMTGLGENAVSFEGECLVSESEGQVTIEFDESANGMDNTRTYLVISEEIVTLNRVGDFSAVMVFEPMRENPVSLASPYGNIGLKLRCEKLQVSRTAGAVDALIHYRFALGEESMQNILKLECRTACS